MLQDIVGSWWFWILIFIVSWPLNFKFWQNIKKGSRRINTFVEEWYQLYKYPFSHDYIYNIMSVLGFPALLFYIVTYVFLFIVTRLASPFLWTWNRFKVDFKPSYSIFDDLAYFVNWLNPNKTRRHMWRLSCTMFKLWKIQYRTF